MNSLIKATLDAASAKSTGPSLGFAKVLKNHGLVLDRPAVQILQVNLGKLCNQACTHCHVDAGPKRTEAMTASTADRLLDLLGQAPEVHTLDLTGGAPELNPEFRRLVSAARAMGRRVIDRCNLTVLFEPGQENTAEFLRDQQVEVVASLPCYSLGNVDRQRGNGTFGRSIQGLRLLNGLGYGQPDSALRLNLVYNPGGPSLPPPQDQLAADYKRELLAHFGIVFNELYALTNLPVRRFADHLERQGKLQAYQQLLLEHFNPSAVAGLMCRSQLSVSWDGQLYDCDFNQMLDLLTPGAGTTLWDIPALADAVGAIAVADHCFGCTAGAGSSCSGAVVG